MKVALCRVADIPPAGVKKIDFFGREALVYLADGRPRAVANVCVHLGGPLEDTGDCLKCPWHGATYSKADGRKCDGPGRPDARLMFLPTRVEDGVLFYTWQE
ncbi:MAG: Rieske 2Fe-2S domain-containing protein [Chloroflexota bacterium]|nr:MAG: Rieske (2Fe-2S) protein [Chloroflexota bacterium]